MGRRFLKRLEQRVEGAGRQHVDFINDVNLSFTFSRRVLRLVTNITNLVNAVVRGRINFDDVGHAAVVDRHAQITRVVRFPSFNMATVQRLGQNFGDTGLPRPTRSTEKIGVAGLLLDQAFFSVVVMASWPITSLNCWGRKTRYSA